MSADRPPAMAPEEESPRHRRYALFVFFLVSVFNYLDRTILAILQVPVKRELGLSDAQLGMLTGLAFALFYATLSLPIARLADRTVRKVVIAVSLVCWCLMTALTGFAASFAMLVLLRIGVAVGEAGSVPAMHSMISDLFPPERRATAISLLGLALPIGTLFGFALGGWLADSLGWRQAFFYIGGAGILLAPLVLLTLREPRRGRYDRVPSDLPTMRQALALLWGLKSFRLLALAGGLNGYVQVAMQAWNAPFYSRSFGMPLGQIAFWLALMNGVGGAIGLYGGGFLADHIGRRWNRGYMLVPGAGVLIVAPVGLLQYLTRDVHVSLACGFVSSACVVFYFAPIISGAHQLVLPRMRALTSAMLVLVVNLMAIGLGPLVTGKISDLLAPTQGTDALRYALASAMGVALVSALLWWRAAHHFVIERHAAIRRGQAAVDALAGAGHGSAMAAETRA
ncbi:MAG: MFS transporter [Burkholderiales bacterium]|nr:MFS transporter [Burkholderiales bacterium]MDE2505047.1 MFS transporter [Burkholderiales bacterium]